MFSLSIKIIAGSLALASTGMATASAADLVEGSYPPRHVRIVHHVHHHTVRPTYISSDRLDCGQVVYEYRTSPPYSEIKTMCGPKPVVYDTAVIVPR